MITEKNHSLRRLNTFGIEARSREFCRFSTAAELAETLAYVREQKLPLLILGGGSNILFTRNWDGLTAHNTIDGIEIVREDTQQVWVRAGAGVIWHQWVLWAVERNLGGMENLSLIPGTAGAGPMQNIGAYGVELKDIFQELEACHIPTGEWHTFSADDCKFGYRNSVFKNVHKGEYVIGSVTLRLQKDPSVFHTAYGAIAQELEKMQAEPDVQSISKAVINIRSSKLPDPAQIGNAGSFFKNPSVPVSEYERIKNEHPDMPSFPGTEPGTIKIPAGWLIEKSGWKGFREGDAGVHKLQALVLVNYGQASGDQIWQLSERILHDVQQRFGVELEREVNVV
ncbi:MAG: UDP-N-acetylmuramate dehydrogenase [Flavobacteriales bacterium]